MQVADVFIDLDPEEGDHRAKQFCCIASGIQLIREVAHPYVLKDNKNFEGCLYNYLRRCPHHLDDEEVPENIPKSHRWWQHATGTKPLHSIWNVRAGTLDTLAGTLAENQPEPEQSGTDLETIEKGDILAQHNIQSAAGLRLRMPGQDARARNPGPAFYVDLVFTQMSPYFSQKG